MYNMKLGRPQDWGLPEKFDSWRRGQEEAILKNVYSKHRFNGIAAPTGFGKSLAYMTTALMLGGRSVILTSTKGQQDQLLRDFSHIGLVDIRGRGNYRCTSDPDKTCEDGYHSGCSCRGSVSCPWSAAYFKVMSSQLVVTNYACFMLSYKYGDGLGYFQNLICDEAHSIVDELSNVLQIDISANEAGEMLKVPFPIMVTDLGVWKEWANSHLSLAQRVRDEWKAICNVKDPKPSWVRNYMHARNLYRKLSMLARIFPVEWVVDETEWGYQFDPIRVGRYAESTLFLKIPKVILASATLRPKTLKMLNVGEFGFTEVDSSFPVERCPVYHVPGARMDNRTSPGEYVVWGMRMDQIIRNRLDRKGIIQTVSFERAKYIKDRSEFSQYMVMNKRGDPTSKMINQFKFASKPRILVSPSVSTGYDFPYDACEYQIIAKVPFPDSRSKIVAARQAIDREYGPYIAMQTLVQSCGRDMRADDDQSEVFVVDDHIKWFLPKFRHLAPRSFLSRFKFVNGIPNPPEALRG